MLPVVSVVFVVFGENTAPSGATSSQNYCFQSYLYAEALFLNYVGRGIFAESVTVAYWKTPAVEIRVLSTAAYWRKIRVFGVLGVSDVLAYKIIAGGPRLSFMWFMHCFLPDFAIIINVYLLNQPSVSAYTRRIRGVLRRESRELV